MDCQEYEPPFYSLFGQTSRLPWENDYTILEVRVLTERYTQTCNHVILSRLAVLQATGTGGTHACRPCSGACRIDI